jgi:hypothetical protein
MIIVLSGPFVRSAALPQDGNDTGAGSSRHCRHLLFLFDPA